MFIKRVVAKAGDLVEVSFHTIVFFSLVLGKELCKFICSCLWTIGSQWKIARQWCC